MAEEVIFIKSDDAIVLRIEIAKNLYLKNFGQSKISRILNISQPMVSNYLKSKNKINKNISDLAEKISRKIVENNNLTINTCMTFSEKPIEGFYYIASKNEIISDENKKIVDNLSDAFLLLKGKDISGLIPEIKINIAMAKDNAESPEDVAAFLNGLVIADDKITNNNGIRFGKSRHLSALLLNLKKSFDANAIMNIAYIKDIKKTGFSFSYLTKNFKLGDNEKNVDILLHRGDFGIEPCAYIIGKDAVDVVNKVIKLKEES